MNEEKLNDENIKKYERSNVWMELNFESIDYSKNEYLKITEHLKSDKRIVNIFDKEYVIIHSKDLASFLKSTNYMPTYIQTLAEANLSEELVSINTVRDILLSEDFASEIIDIDYMEINRVCEEILEKCKLKINKLPVEEVKKFDLGYPNFLLAEEARIALLPFYIEYRNKLLLKVKDIDEKIKKIKQMEME